MIVFHRQSLLLPVCLIFLLLAIQAKAQSRVLYSAMSSSGRIAVSDRKYIDIYDSDFVYQKTLTVIPPQEEVSNIELYWSPDETFLAVQKSGNGLGTHEVTEIWRVDTGELLGVIPNNYFAVENTLVWHPDSQSLAVVMIVGFYVFEFRIYSIHGALLNTWENVRGGLRQLVWSPDGQYIVMDVTNQLKLWDVGSESEIGTLSIMPYFNLPAFSPDGRYIAFTDLSYEGAGQDVQIWQVEPLRYVRTLTGAQRNIYALSWTTQGVMAANNAADVKVWEPDTGEITRTISLGDVFNRMQDWSADGIHILVSQRDNTLIIRDTLNGDILASLTHEEWLAQHSLEISTPQPTTSSR